MSKVCLIIFTFLIINFTCFSQSKSHITTGLFTENYINDLKNVIIEINGGVKKIFYNNNIKNTQNTFWSFDEKKTHNLESWKDIFLYNKEDSLSLKISLIRENDTIKFIRKIKNISLVFDINITLGVKDELTYLKSIEFVNQIFEDRLKPVKLKKGKEIIFKIKDYKIGELQGLYHKNLFLGEVLKETEPNQYIDYKGSVYANNFYKLVNFEKIEQKCKKGYCYVIVGSHCNTVSIDETGRYLFMITLKIDETKTEDKECIIITKKVLKLYHNFNIK